MTSTYAKIIADSISPAGIRLTTLELYYPLMIHAQAKTHRILSLDDECYIETNYSVGLMDDPMLSRNAQSNRAMPVVKMLEQVINNPAMPSHWGKNQAGMQDAGENNDLVDLGYRHGMCSRESAWKSASRDAIVYAQSFSHAGYHKQVANRLTMPFQYIKVIVTATEWDNFFKLRLNDADPTMMELARKMKEAMDNSTPKLLQPGEWHLPYVNENDDGRLVMSMFSKKEHLLDTRRKCSVARVARVSLNNHDKSDPDISKDIDRHDQLARDYHMSPFEHQAIPMEIAWDDGLNGLNYEDGVTHIDRNGNLWSGNLKGWIQYRQLL